MNIKYTYNPTYQEKISETLDNAVRLHKRITAVRVDVRIPDGYIDGRFPTAIITRFFESLKAKIAADLLIKERRWQKNLTCQLKFVWVREFGPISGKKHFHILLFLNKDVYHSLGDFNKESGNLSAMIRQAWCSALGLPFAHYYQLVHFPCDGVVYMDLNQPEFALQRELVLSRANYLAKEATKRYGDGERSFGCSR